MDGSPEKKFKAYNPCRTLIVSSQNPRTLLANKLQEIHEAKTFAVEECSSFLLFCDSCHLDGAKMRLENLAKALFSYVRKVRQFISVLGHHSSLREEFHSDSRREFQEFIKFIKMSWKKVRQQLESWIEVPLPFIEREQLLITLEDLDTFFDQIKRLFRQNAL